MTSRLLELILKVNNQSASELSKFRSEIEAILKAMKDGGSPFKGASDGLGTVKTDLTKLAELLGTSRQVASDLKDELGLTAKAAADAVTRLKSLADGSTPDQQFRTLNSELGITLEQFEKIAKASDSAFDPASITAGTRALITLASSLGQTIDQAEALKNSLNLPADSIEAAIASVKQLSTTDLTIDDQFDSLNRDISITREQFEALYKVATGKDIKPIKFNVQEIAGLASSLKLSYQDAQKLAQELNKVPGDIKRIVAELQRFQEIGLPDEELEKYRIGQNLTKDQFTSLRVAAGTFKKEAGDIPASGLDGLKKSATSLFQTLGEVSLAFNNIQQTLGTIQAVGAGAFNFLIGSNEKLNAQVLSSQTNLASATRIFRDGVELTDPTEKIKSTSGALGAALKQIEKDTQSLVGVTSEDVNSLFQITLTNAAALNKQSQEFPGPIEAAQKLTVGWSAALKTINLPLNQASQEITSILKGQITQDSMLAKNLGINNAMVAQWKAQGTLVDELNKKLSVFAAGNAIAANSIEGISSNFLDIFQIIGREAGKPLLDPLVKGMAAVYAVLDANKVVIIDFFKGFASVVIDAGKKLQDSFAPVFAAILENIKVQGPALKAAFEAVVATVAAVGTLAAPLITGLLQSVATLTAAITPIIQTIAELAQGFAELVQVINPLSGLLTTLGGQELGLVNSELGQLGLKVAAAVAAVVAFAGPVSSMVASVTAAAAPIAAMTSGLGFLPAVLAVVSGAWAAATGAATAFAVSAWAAVAPLIPLAAAIGTVVVAYEALKLASVNDSLDVLSETTNRLADESLKYAQELKNLNRIEADAGKLTPEQEARKKLLISLTQDTSAAIKQQIADLKALKPANDEQANNIKTQIALLEQREKLLSKQNQLELKQNDIKDQGDILEQLAEKATNAKRAIADAATAADAGTAAKELISLTKTQLEYGQISAEEASKRIDAIAKNGKLEVDVRQSAIKELSGIAKSEQAEFEARNKDQLTEIQRRVDTGVESEVRGEEQILEVRRAGGARRLELLREQLATEESEGRGSGDAAAKLRSQITSQQAEIAKIEIEGAKKIQDARFAEIEKTERKATNALKSAELERQIDSQKLINAGTITKEEANQRRLTSTKQTLQAELEAEKKTLVALEALPKTGNRKLDQQREEKIREAKTQTAQLTLKLLENEQAVQEAITAAAIKKIERQQQAIKNQTEQAVQGAQKEIAAQELITKAIERRSALLKSQQDLQSALAGLVSSQYGQAVSLLESQFAAEDKLKDAQEKREAILKRIAEAKTPEERKAVQKELEAIEKQEKREAQIRDLKIAAKRAELAALARSQELAIISFNLEEQKTAALRKQEEIRLRIEAIQAKANIAQAEADLAKARADKQSTPEAIRAAELQIEAAKAKATGITQQQGALGAQAGLDSAANRNRFEVLLAEQDQARLRVRTDLAQLTPEAEDDQRAQAETYREINISTRVMRTSFQEATDSANAFNQAINEATAALNKIKSPTAIPSFRDGGGSPAGIVAAGEVGPEIVAYNGGGFGLMASPGLYNMPDSGFVYTADQTAAIMAPASTYADILRAGPMMRSTPFIGAMAGADTMALLSEIRGLRMDIASRPNPDQKNNFTFVNEQNPDGRALALSQRLMQQQLRRGGF